MKLRIITPLCLVLVGCAQLGGGESPLHAGRMKDAGDVYLGCVARESEKEMKNPISAEDIATAAHGRCWADWVSYRDATNANFAYNARGREEMQFAHDKAEAHLRQFEREARRAVVDAVVARSLKGGVTHP